MIGFFRALFELWGKVMAFLHDRGVEKAAEAKVIAAEVKEVEARVEKAEDVVRTDNPERTARLRKRFDRSQGGE